MKQRYFGTLLFMSLIATGSSLSAQTKETPKPETTQTQKKVSHFQWSGEELYYSVRVNGVEAVRSAIKVGDIRYKGDRAYVPVAGSAQSVGFFDAIYPMRDTANSYVSPTTFRPLRSEKLFNENGKKRSYEVDYVHTTYQARVVKTKFAMAENQKTKKRKFSRAIPGTTHDMISWFFELRKKGKMKVGDSFSFYLYDGWKLSRIDGKVVGKEDIYTPIGWFKTFKIDFSREVLRSKFQEKGQPPILKVKTESKPTGSLFISRDANLIPVAIRIHTKWGSSESVLMKYRLPKAARKEK